VEDIDHPLEGSDDFVVILSKSCKGPSLMVENVHDRVNSMAILKLPGERMVDQSQPCLFFIALQGCIEE